jgi:carbon-monoxide dehydrogenase medium subunit
MKPAPFDYHAPKTISAALELLIRHVGDARLLAGGQTLMPMMNFRLAAPSVLIDLNRVEELDFIEDAGDVVRIGAMTRQRSLEFSALIAEKLPLLSKAIQMVGHLPTRSRGTIGGSLANADSAAELPMVLQVLEGEVLVAGPKGQRAIKSCDLFVDSMVTTLAEDEILTEVRIPVMPSSARFAVDEFSRRRGDFAIAAVAAVLTFKGSHCKRARLATAGVSSIPTRLLSAEGLLEGQILDATVIAKAADAAAVAIEPITDRNASEAYRRHLTKTLTMRVLQQAWHQSVVDEATPPRSTVAREKEF